MDSISSNNDLIRKLKNEIAYYVNKRSSTVDKVAVFLEGGEVDIAINEIFEQQILQKLNKLPEETIPTVASALSITVKQALNSKEIWSVKQYIANRLSIKTNVAKTWRENLLADLQTYQTTSIQSPTLQLIQKQIRFVSPTSIEQERKFSETGRLIGLIRTRLWNVSLHSLIVIKKFYKFFLPNITN